MSKLEEVAPEPEPEPVVEAEPKDPYQDMTIEELKAELAKK